MVCVGGVDGFEASSNGQVLFFMQIAGAAGREDQEGDRVDGLFFRRVGRANRD